MNASAAPRVVVAFDGSDSARVAIDRAGELLAGATATIVTVAQGVGSLVDASRGARLAMPDEAIREAIGRLREQKLAEVRELAEEGRARAAEAGLEADARTAECDGAVAATIADVAEELGADAIVCGTRGHGAAARAVLGSVATGLVRHGSRPVLVVPADAASASGPVLVGYDGSEAAGDAVRVAGRLLGGRVAVVTYCWRSQIRHTLTGAAMRHAPAQDVRDLVGDLDAMFTEEAEQVAGDGAKLAREAGLDARASAAESPRPVVQALLAEADNLDAAVIVAGPRGRGAVASAVLGSVTSSLLHASSRPVLVAGHGR